MWFLSFFINNALLERVSKWGSCGRHAAHISESTYKPGASLVVVPVVFMTIMQTRTDENRPPGACLASVDQQQAGDWQSQHNTTFLLFLPQPFCCGNFSSILLVCICTEWAHTKNNLPFTSPVCQPSTGSGPGRWVHGWNAGKQGQAWIKPRRSRIHDYAIPEKWVQACIESCTFIHYAIDYARP